MGDSRDMLAPPNRTKVSLLTSVKWVVFRLLEWVSDLRGNHAAGYLELARPDRPVQALWVFVSTIGELNAIDPLLQEIVYLLPKLKLVLITDHQQYRDNYLARHPDAAVCVTRGHSSDAITLAQHYPPRLLVVAEIPCLPSDAPCRFSFAFLYAAKRSGAAAVLVNAWLSHSTPASRMDAIERRLFLRDYVRAFDVICAQTEEIRQHLLAAGARAECVAVAGNIKFDAMPQGEWSPNTARSAAMLVALVDSSRPVVVAGCVSSLSEQQRVLDAFMIARQSRPDVLLILAPRHPELRDRMRMLSEYLDQRGLTSAFRSTLPDEPIDDQVSCLVLDTMGELRDFYAAASISYVGVNHNVLEPLAFGKAVTILQGWDDKYPSYPVYRTLLDANVLIEAENAEDLSRFWIRLLGQSEGHGKQTITIGESLVSLRGAVKLHLRQIEPVLSGLVQT